ncbi:MAG: hypothetical protein IPH78_15160 [Bacteroidetes bacterium]|nr:hypothetical protein [Bacteroidota bacterium]
MLLNTWLIFMVVGIAYGVYLLSGFAATLWQHGIWFTENDVLHVGMIGWVYYLFNNTRQVVVDSEPAGF